MSKLIVGCGYLGARVARLWLDAGERVCATTRRRSEELQRLGIEPLVCDVLDRGALQGALTQVQPATVVYCVALDRTAGQSMRDVYVQGLRNFLEVCPPTERFVYVSSTSVYGQVNGEEVDETSATEPIEESGKIVLEAETVLAQLRPAAVVLRFSGIYGPGRLLRRQAIEAGTPIVADPDKWLNVIHVDDGARAVLAACARAQAGALYNVSDGLPVRRRDYYAKMAELLGAPPPRLEPVPPGAPAPPHEAANRRIFARRLRQELMVTPVYGSFDVGLAASV